MIKLTIQEWSEIFEMEVFDPDGFDRNDPNFEHNVYTKEKFLDGAMRSTCGWNNDSPFMTYTRSEDGKIIMENSNENYNG